MSLNQLTTEGKVGGGLDIDCRSLVTDPLIPQLFNDVTVQGDLTVLQATACASSFEAAGTATMKGVLIAEGSSNLQGAVTADSSLRVAGALKLGAGPGIEVVLTGIHPVANQAFLPQAGHVTASSNDWQYQSYGSVLKIQGRFGCQLLSPVLSRYFTVGFSLPAGYTIGGSFVSRYASGVGNGSPVFVTTDTQPLVMGGVSVTNGTDIVMVWTTGDGAVPRIIAGVAHVCSFEITFDTV